MNKVSTAGELTHPRYRPDIDGLRAVAILSVVGFHAFPNWVPGGYTGVDVFFVISGFLISTIILENLASGKFSFIEFYARRIRRIFPALILVLVACLVAGWFLLLMDEYRQLGKHVAGGAGFIANFILQKEVGYFDTEASSKPLLHLWSLGIEEQFYIVWPFVLWIAFRRKVTVLPVILCLGFASFAYGITSVADNRSAAFYSPFARFWELMVGVLLAYARVSPPQWFAELKGKTKYVSFAIRRLPVRITLETILLNTLSILGAFLLFVSFFKLTRETIFPGWRALLPTLGAACVLAAGPKALFNQLVLARRVPVWFGLISFPLYLWHWPLLSFAWILNEGAPSQRITKIIVVLSILLAWLSYKFVEQPIRRGNRKAIKAIMLMIFMTLVGFTGYVCFAEDGFEFRNPVYNAIAKAFNQFEFPADQTPYLHNEYVMYRKDSHRPRTTLFIGDSNIEHYYPRINELIKTKPDETNSAIFASGPGCLLAPHTFSAEHMNCVGFLEAALSQAISEPNISTVVIGMQWYGDLSGETRWFYVDKDEQLLVTPKSEGYEKSLASLKEYIAELKNAHKKVVLVLNIPVGTQLDPKYIVHRKWEGFHLSYEIRDEGVPMATLEEKYGVIKRDLIKLGKESGVKIVDPMQYLCDKNVCPSLDKSGEPIYKDTAHLRPIFVRHQATFLDFTMYQ